MSIDEPKSFAVLLLLVAVGCAGTPAAPDETSLTGGEQLPTYFRQIPADSTLVLAGTEPLPEALFLEVLRGGSSMTAEVGAKVASLSALSYETPPMLKAVGRRFARTQAAERFRDFGLTLRPHVAAYTLGAKTIVYRLELGDVEAFRAFLSEMEAEARADVVEKSTGDGRRYRVYRDAGEETDVRMPVVIRDGAVHLTVVPEAALEVVVPHLLGDRLPQKSLAETRRIQSAAARYGLQRYGVLTLDVRRSFRMKVGLARPGALVRDVVEVVGPHPAREVEELSRACREATERAASKMPLLVGGVRAWSESDRRFRLAGEFDQATMKSLRTIAKPMPGADMAEFQNAALALAVGWDGEAAGAEIDRVVKEIRSDVAVCQTADPSKEDGEDEQAQRGPKLSRSLLSTFKMAYQRFMGRVPPPFKTIDGLTVIIEHFDYTTTDSLRFLEGAFLLRADSPTRLATMTRMFAPGMGRLKPDGELHSLDQLAGRFPVIDEPHAGMTSTTLGFSVGSAMVPTLQSLLNADSGETVPGGTSEDAPMPLLSLRMDLNAIYEGLPASSRGLFDSISGEGEGAEGGTRAKIGLGVTLRENAAVVSWEIRRE